MKFFLESFNKDYFDLLLVLTYKEIKVRYKGAVAGFLWVVINPLMQMLIIGFVFSYFVHIQNYYLFLFVGLLPWQFFSLSLSKATTSFVDQRELLQKTKFPREIIPISIVLSSFINFMISMGLLIVFLLVTNQLSIYRLGFIFLALVWLFALAICVSLFTAALNVHYRDVNFFTQSFLLLWFYATPILYNLDQVSDQIKFFLSFNPLVSIFEIFHLVFLNNGTLSYQILVTNILVSVIGMMISVITFKKLQLNFVDWL